MLRRRLPERPSGLPASLRPRALILLYHRLSGPSVDPWGLCVSASNFAEQLSVLADTTEPLPLSQLPSALRTRSIRRKPLVAVTFDDGYADNSTHAVPLLAQHSVPATVFVVSSYVGSSLPFWWDLLAEVFLGRAGGDDHVELEIGGTSRRWDLSADEQSRRAAHLEAWSLLRAAAPAEREEALGPLAAAHGASFVDGCRPLSPSELRRLDAHPLVDIGAHTLSHAVLASLDLDAQRGEIENGKRALESMLGHPVELFSYPHGQAGDFTDETTTLVRDAGFALACSAVPGIATHRSDLYRLPRLVVSDWDGHEFERRLSPFLR